MMAACCDSARLLAARTVGRLDLVSASSRSKAWMSGTRPNANAAAL